MSAPPTNEPAAGPPAFRVEPYARLVRSLLPRASSLAMFGPAGELMWSSETTTGPDLMNVVDDALSGARTNPGSGGQLRLLAGNQPVYLCPMRDDAGQLLGVVAVVCRPSDSQDEEAAGLLVRALAARARARVPAPRAGRRMSPSPTSTPSSSELNRDLGLLLTHGASEQSSAAADGAGDLQLLLQQTVEHLRALTGALLVPEKNLTLLRAAGSGSADARFLMRAHRKLLALAQARREPLIINEIAVAVPDTYPYRVLCCALRSRAGRCLGVLTLLRDETGEHFTERDAHIAQILARKSLDIIESSYDALSGLYTRPAFERRVSAVIADPKTRQRWSALYIDVDQLHAINEKSGMHVGDSVLGQIGELVRSRLPPGAFGARISGDRFAVLLPAQVAGRRALRPGAARRESSSCRPFRGTRGRRSRSASAWRSSTATPPSWHTCWRPPRPPARRPRIAAAIASRFISRAIRASCAAMRTSASPGSCAKPSTPGGCGSTRSSSCRSPPPTTPGRTTSCCCA